MAAVDPKNRYDFLDVARGVAALLVLVEHGLDVYIPGFYPWSVSVGGPIGRVGVLIFLMITGFIIPPSLERSGSAGRFWVRRIFRLFPAYWLSVAVAMADPPAHRVLALDDTQSWLVNLTMLQGFVGVKDAWGVYWTLYVELIVYAACTVLFLTRLTNHWTGLLVAVIVGYGAVGIGYPLVRGKIFAEVGHRLLYLAPLVGVGLQLVVSGRLSRRGAYGLLAAWALTYGAVCGVNSYLFPGVIPGDVIWQHYLMNGAAVAVLFGLAELRHRRMPAAAAWFGRISYSVYLFHGIWLHFLQEWGWPLRYRVPAYFGLVTATAAAVYYLAERPGIALGRKLERLIWGAKKPPTRGEAPELTDPTRAVAA